MRVWLALPLCCLAVGYVGLSLSFHRQRARYLAQSRESVLRQVRCFSQDVTDYSATPGDASPHHDAALRFPFCAVTGPRDAPVIGLPGEVSLPLSFVGDSGLWKLETLYDLYCHLVALPALSTAEVAMRQNLCHALQAILEHRLLAMSSSETAMLSPEETCNTMVIAAMAQRLAVPVPLDAHIYRGARRAFARDGSASWSVLVFVRSLLRACGWKALGASGVVLLLQTVVLEFLSPAYMVGTATLCFSELVRHESALTGEVRWYEFALSVLASADSAGQLLAAAVLLDTARTLLATVRDAVGNLILHQHNDHLREAAILAVARMDYTGDTDWPVPHRVYGALGSVTNFTFASVDMWVGSVLERADLCMTCAAHPLEAAVLWVVQQALVRVENLVGVYENLIKYMSTEASGGSTAIALPAQSDVQAGVESTHTLNVPRAHYGLTLWLDVAADIAALRTAEASPSTDMLWHLAGLTRYPYSSEPEQHLTAEAISSVISHVPLSPSVVGIATWMRRKQALLCPTAAKPACTALSPSDGLTTVLPVNAPRTPWQNSGVADGISLHLARRHGLGCSAITTTTTVAGRYGAHRATEGNTSQDVARAVVDRLLQSCDSLPVLAVLLVGTSSTATHVSPSVTAASLERLLQNAATPSRPFLFSAVSPFAYAVQSQQYALLCQSDYVQSMRYLSRLISTPPLIDCVDQERRLPLPQSAWAIAFEHVWFRYPGSAQWALQDVTFTLPAGSFLGIVGFSGAGKTSVLLLIARMYAPTRGRILLNGHPIECFPARSLRRQLAHSWQAPATHRFLDACTVETNVALGHLPTASTASVRAALHSAHALEFVESRARGLKNRLDPSTLSGGEVERLSLARTFMKDAQHAGLYLLDECTSALDSSTEEAVMQPLCLAASLGTATRIMVTHRLSSIRGADLILVLEGGRVAEQGSWSSLVYKHEHSDCATLFGTLLVSQTQAL